MQECEEKEKDKVGDLLCIEIEGGRKGKETDGGFSL